MVSSAGGIYEYERLRSSLVAVVPQIKRQEEENQNGPGRWQSKGSYNRNNRPANKANAVDQGGEDGPVDGDDRDLVEDPDQLELEAEVLLTHAARKRAEISKNRGYNKPESQEARTQRIQNMKDRMPCAACQAVGVTAHGHGHSDESCPQRQKNKQSPAKHTFVVSQQHMEESESDDDVFFVGLTSGNMMDEHMGCHFSGAVVLATSSSMREVTKELALADTCAGLSWVEHHLEQLAERGMPFQMVPDDQPFRFGDGPRVTPLWAAIFPIYVGRRMPCWSGPVWSLKTSPS